MEDWRVEGPMMATGSVVINRTDGMCVAALKKPAGPPEYLRNLAELWVRSEVRDAMLEMIRDDLKGDDDGTRHQDLIAMLDAELARTVAWRLRNAKLKSAAAVEGTATPVDPGTTAGSVGETQTADASVTAQSADPS